MTIILFHCPSSVFFYSSCRPVFSNACITIISQLCLAPLVSTSYRGRLNFSCTTPANSTMHFIQGRSTLWTWRMHDTSFTPRMLQQYGTKYHKSFSITYAGPSVVNASLRALVRRLIMIFTAFCNKPYFYQDRKCVMSVFWGPLKAPLQLCSALPNLHCKCYFFRKPQCHQLFLATTKLKSFQRS